MWRTLTLFSLLAAGLLAAAQPAHAQSVDDPYNIIKPEPGRRTSNPEPWLAPKYQSPRNAPRQDLRPRDVERLPQARVPPPIYVPQTGRLIPNMPTVSGSGPGGRETSQDRAMRCAHQAGAYGSAVGDPNAYLGSCVTQ